MSSVHNGMSKLLERLPRALRPGWLFSGASPLELLRRLLSGAEKPGLDVRRPRDLKTPHPGGFFDGGCAGGGAGAPCGGGGAAAAGAATGIAPNETRSVDRACGSMGAPAAGNTSVVVWSSFTCTSPLTSMSML